MKLFNRIVACLILLLGITVIGSGPITSTAVALDEPCVSPASTLVQTTGSLSEPPPSGTVVLRIDVSARKLTVFSDGTPFRTFSVAVGKKATSSPVGEWKIINKAVNWGDGFGTRWMGLNVPWGIYGIHGTNKPWSIGTPASHGCIRMHNKDVELLYKWVELGTEVQIMGLLPRKKNPPELKRGAANQDVVQLQFLLREAGVFSGYADGRFGEITEQAVKTFQLIQEMPDNGLVDRVLWSKLWDYTEQQKQAVNG